MLATCPHISACARISVALRRCPDSSMSLCVHAHRTDAHTKRKAYDDIHAYTLYVWPYLDEKKNFITSLFRKRITQGRKRRVEEKGKRKIEKKTYNFRKNSTRVNLHLRISPHLWFFTSRLLHTMHTHRYVCTYACNAFILQFINIRKVHKNSVHIRTFGPYITKSIHKGAFTVWLVQ